MFEELRDDAEFRGLTQEQRQAKLEQFKVDTLNPLFEQRGVSPEKRQKITALVEKDYAREAYKTNWQMMKDSALDLVYAPARLMTSMNYASNELAGRPIAYGLSRVLDDPSWLENFNARQAELKKDLANYTFSADAKQWNDAATEGMFFGSGMAGLINKTANAGMRVLPVLEDVMGQTFGRGVSSTALSEGLQNVATEAIVGKGIDPLIDKTTWDDSTKEVAKGVAYFGTGLVGGLTYGLAFDKIIGNPMFKDVVEQTISKARKAPYEHLTFNENVIKHLVNDKDAVSQLHKLFTEAVDAPRINEGMTPSVSAKVNQQLQGLIDQAVLEDNILSAQRQKAGLGLTKDLTDVEQSKLLASMIDESLTNTAAERAGEKAVPDFHTQMLLDTYGKFAQALEGETVLPTESAPIKWFARLNKEDKIVLRASDTPSSDVLQQLKSVGLFWQPKKRFNADDASTAGVFYGPNTPEAHAKVREIFETSGQPVSAAKPEVKPEVKPGDFSTSGIEGNTMVRLNEPNEKAVELLQQFGFKPNEEGVYVGKSNIKIASELKKIGLTSEPLSVAPTTAKDLRLRKTLTDFEKGKKLDGFSGSAAVPSDTQVLKNGWRSVSDGTPATPLNKRVGSQSRWIDDATVAQRYPEAAKALGENSSLKSLKEGWTFDDVMRTTVNTYNKFRPGQLLDEGQIAGAKRQLSELEDLLESGWKDQPVLNRSKEQLNLAYRKMVDDGVFTPQQYKTVTGILQNFRKFPGFDVAGTNVSKSYYSFLNNVVYLRQADDFFHETGHWAWLHVLDKQDRLDFFERSMVKYGTSEAWDGLWPVRKQYGKAMDKSIADYPMNTYAGHFQNVTELYADMFRRYVHAFKMPEAESSGIMSKMLKACKAIYKPLLKQGDEIPKDMRTFVERVINTPMPREGKMRLAELDDLVQSQRLYQDRQTFEQSVSASLDAVDRPMQDQFLMDLLTTNETALDAWVRSGANVEKILNRLYVDVLANHHLDVGDQKALEAVVVKLRDLFEPANKQSVIDRIKAFGSTDVENKYGRALEDDQTTMPTTQTLSEVKRDIAQQSERKEAFMDSGAEVQYRAMKQFYNDTVSLYQASKFQKSRLSSQTAKARSAAAIPAREEWGALQMRLADEELMRRQPQTSLDIEGNVAEFGDRKFVTGSADGSDEVFENAFKGFRDDEIRYMQLQFWPQVVSFGAGLHTDSENGIPIPGTSINLNWSAQQWFDSGYGPALSAYAMFGKGLRGKAKQVMLNKWSTLPEELQRELAQKWTGVSKHPAVRIWRQGDGLDADLRRLVRNKTNVQNRVSRSFYDTATELNKKLTLDEQRMCAEIITKQGDLDVTQASPKVQQAAQQIQNMFKGIKTELIEAGIPEHLVADFGQSYLPQVFEAHAKSWWMNGIEGMRLRNLYDTINAKILQPQGMNHKLRSTDKAMQAMMGIVKAKGLELKPGMLIDEFVDEAGERVFLPKSEMVQGVALQTWKVTDVGKRGGSVSLNRPYSKLERSMLKEETSVVPRLVEFGRKSGKLIAQARTFKSIAENANLTIDPAMLMSTLGKTDGEQAVMNFTSKGWQVVPNTEAIPGSGIKRYGALAGKLVDPEAMYALRNITSEAPQHPVLNAMFQTYKTGLSLWKIGKTAFNPTTHGINFIGNSAMCVMDGRNPASVLMDGASALKAKGEVYKLAIDNGMFDSNILKSELGLDNFMRDLRGMPNQHATQGAESAIAAWMKGVSRGAKAVGKAAAYWPMRIYELGDQVYKMGVFAQEYNAGKSAEQAIAQANELFFDYSDVPTGVKAIRDWGILPFVSYTYKLIPKLADFAVNNPHRILGLLGTLQLTNEIVMHQEWGSDFKDVQRWQEEVMPDWMNRKTYGKRGGILLGSGKNAYGHEYTEWLDYSQVIPGADLMNDGGIFRGLPFGTNPIMSIVSGLATNQDPSLHNQIAPYPDADAPDLTKRNTEARLRFVMRTLLPNLPVYPGAYSVERLGQALTGSGVIDKQTADTMGWTGQDYYGTSEDATSEMLGYVTGMRTRRLYGNQETVRELEKLRFGIKKEANEFERRLADKRMSPSEIDQQTKKLIGVTQHNTDQIQRLGEVYRKAQTATAQSKKGR